MALHAPLGKNSEKTKCDLFLFVNLLITVNVHQKKLVLSQQAAC